MRRNLRRGVVAMAAVGMCVVTTAVPAAAVTTGLTISSGDVLLAKTGQPTRTMTVGGGSTGAACAASITVETTASTVDVTALSISTRTQPFGPSTSWFILEVARTGSVAATNSNATTNTASGSSVTVNAKIWIATDQSDAGTSCAHGTSTTDSTTPPPFGTLSDRRANWSTTIPSISLGGYTTTGGGGDITNPASSDTATINSSSSPPLIGVSHTPLAVYSLGSLKLSNWVIHAF